MRLCTEHMGLLLSMDRREDHWELQVADESSGTRLYQACCTDAIRGRTLLGDYLRTQLARRYGKRISVSDADLIWVQVQQS